MPGGRRRQLGRIGIEEEYFIVDPVTRAPAPKADLIVRRAAETLGERVTTEFTQYQVEAKTPPPVGTSGICDMNCDACGRR